MCHEAEGGAIHSPLSPRHPIGDKNAVNRVHYTMFLPDVKQGSKTAEYREFETHHRIWSATFLKGL